MDLTGFVFFTIEQNAKLGPNRQLLETYEFKADHWMCDVQREVTSVRSPRLDSTSTPKSNEAYGITGESKFWGQIRRNPRGHDTGSVFPARASDLRVPLYLERPTLRGMIFWTVWRNTHIHKGPKKPLLGRKRQPSSRDLMRLLSRLDPEIEVPLLVHS